MLLLPGEISHQNNNENVTEQIKVWGVVVVGAGGWWPNTLHLDASQFRGSPLCAGLFTRLLHRHVRGGVMVFMVMSHESKEEV